MPPSNRSHGALFDVEPVNESGSVDVQKIQSVEPVINLSSYRPQKISLKAPARNQSVRPQKKEPAVAVQEPENRSHSVKREFEDLFNSEVNLEVELARVDGQALGNTPGRPRYRVIQQKPIISKISMPRVIPSAPADDDVALGAIVSEIQHSASLMRRDDSDRQRIMPAIAVPPTAEEKSILTPFNIRQPILASLTAKRKIPKKHFAISSRTKKWAIVVVAMLACASAFAYYVVHVKHAVIQESNAAVQNLQNAHDDLKTLNLQNASQDFLDAYQNFSKAGDSLNFMGATISSIIGELPGGGSVKSANNLVEAGQLLADAGAQMTQAMSAVAKTGAVLNPTNPNVSIGPIIASLQKALAVSNTDVAKANTLFADVDESVIPADKQADFNNFKSELPAFAQTISQSADYANFFENLINVSGSKRYLILFQNSSELRPTGGFPGTYAIVSFTDGQLDSFSVDDIYNIDGQMKQNIVPPLQMQHIAPTWDMRDSAWYADYPTSARNVEDFYTKESNGQTVDGVIVVNPELISDILKVVGPIPMPQYGLTLTADNVLTTIQDQVEYGTNRVEPKQIVKDFAPLLLQKIYSAKSDQWLSIFNSVVAAMSDKEMLMFFNDLSLENFATSQGFGGQVKQVSGDYVFPVITNIKGSKTDAVTDTSFGLTTQFDGSDAIHTLTITRTHNGGNEQFGFYNKQNPAYVRVLVPANAQLISVTGNDNPDFQPLVNYNNGTFTRDDELNTFETSGQTNTTTDVTTYSESGKAEFGFWLITNPGATKTVTVQYRVPNVLASTSYELYVQKQPGLVVKNFSFSMQKPPNGLTPTASAPLLTQNGTEFNYSAPLTDDLPLKVNFQ